MTTEILSPENKELLRENPYYRSRLNHLEEQHPQALLNHLQAGTLDEHLLDVADRAVQAEGKMRKQNPEMQPEQARELVMNQLVADPEETSQVNSLEKAHLKSLLKSWKSQNRTTAPARES